MPSPSIGRRVPGSAPGSRPRTGPGAVWGGGAGDGSGHTRRDDGSRAARARMVPPCAPPAGHGSRGRGGLPRRPATFLPDLPVAEAYADEAVAVQRIDGIATSSASQPSMMAIMLEQLAARPGDRVLEIGAGTGYNAALLSRIVGATGAVTSVDIDAELIDSAARHLAAAGVGGVELVCADGALGYPPGPPTTGSCSRSAAPTCVRSGWPSWPAAAGCCCRWRCAAASSRWRWTSARTGCCAAARCAAARSSGCGGSVPPRDRAARRRGVARCRCRRTPNCSRTRGGRGGAGRPGTGADGRGGAGATGRVGRLRAVAGPAGAAGRPAAARRRPRARRRRPGDGPVPAGRACSRRRRLRRAALVGPGPGLAVAGPVGRRAPLAAPGRRARVRPGWGRCPAERMLAALAAWDAAGGRGPAGLQLLVGPRPVAPGPASPGGGPAAAARWSPRPGPADRPAPLISEPRDETRKIAGLCNNSQHSALWEGAMDLNSDLGESFGRWTLGDDAAMLDIVTSANVACGFHAGDPTDAAPHLRAGRRSRGRGRGAGRLPGPGRVRPALHRRATRRAGRRRASTRSARWRRCAGWPAPRCAT